MSTTAADGRFLLLSSSEAIAKQLSAHFGRDFERELSGDLKPGDLVLLDARSAHASEGMPLGHAFAACRQVKAEPRTRVFLIVEGDDGYSAEIARFCLADGCLAVGSDGSLADLAGLDERLQPGRPHVSVDALLERLEGKLAGSEREASGIQRLLEERHEDRLVEQLADPETGLFDGPFASFKLDEEFKRASRFHQPLSLILLDCGVAEWPSADADRKAVLAEIASIFLNECRDIDLLARFTRTEFLFLLPGTGLDGASTVALRMLQSLREREFLVPVDLAPAAGLATVPMAGITDRKAFVGYAEACLRQAQKDPSGGGLCASLE